MGDRHPVSRVTRYLGTNYKVQTKVIRVFLLHKQGNGNTSFFFFFLLRIVILVDSINKKKGQYYLFYLLTKKMRRYRYDGGL